MVLKVSDDKKFLIVTDGTKLELDQLRNSFTLRINNWWIIKKKLEEKGKNVSWEGEIKFIDRYNRIPIGLWSEVLKLGKEYYFPIKIEGKEIFTDLNFDEKDFDDWVKNYFEKAKDDKGGKFYPYSFQIESTKKALKYRFCVEEISMSGGKTLISFMLFKYLLDRKKIKKMLYVVPSMDLVTQSADEFLEYEEFCGKEPDWKLEMIFSKAKKYKGNKQISFGTYQSLTRKDLDFFRDYDIVLIDECHHSKASSIKTIIAKCYNAEYRIGLTGTLPKEKSCDFFTIQAYLGPKIHVVSSYKLIKEEKATPIDVIGIELDYLEDKIKENLYNLRNIKNKDGAKLLILERNVARDNRKRFNYIVNKINEVTKNSLVLFADIKYGYGRKIYDWLRENTERNVYYIDGGTEKENRKYYKELMEKEKDIILIASTGTFSEGINIKNLHNIFITESNKSPFIVRQILGRGMRLLKNKEKVLVIDFSDNYKWGTNKWQRKNYLLKHAEERKNIYAEFKFPYKLFKVKL